jgi:hypothetical protein
MFLYNKLILKKFQDYFYMSNLNRGLMVFFSKKLIIGYY